MRNTLSIKKSFLVKIKKNYIIGTLLHILPGLTALSLIPVPLTTLFVGRGNFFVNVDVPVGGVA